MLAFINVSFKNILNYGVQELSIKEKVEIDGGWTKTYYRRNSGGGWIRHEERWEGKRYISTCSVWVASVPSWVTDSIS